MNTKQVKLTKGLIENGIAYLIRIKHFMSNQLLVKQRKTKTEQLVLQFISPETVFTLNISIDAKKIYDKKSLFINPRAMANALFSYIINGICKSFESKYGLELIKATRPNIQNSIKNVWSFIKDSWYFITLIEQSISNKKLNFNKVNLKPIDSKTKILILQLFDRVTGYTRLTKRQTIGLDKIRALSNYGMTMLLTVCKMINQRITLQRILDCLAMTYFKPIEFDKL